ncbi:DUF982 domain-containing protein (plasmid) [Rhizobium lusitanum]|uniref:DUF982 domain-containing protein n=1 Tax=Rhizobium lusitanum TaxID=293958 RepID=UPI00161AF8BB|nr:DUF982 domain-containing protein [Rhizobium lusitanum]QND45163.1 DUF982 domain-containing protein [Rhizobium lusitanum]
MKRDTLRLFPAVTLVMEGTGEYRRVNSVQAATETLLEHWPIEDGEEYLSAIRVCLDAMMGVVHPDAAREALIKAAAEAGVPVMQ